ncbi:hypothetical protein KSP40_PGU017655 [Platanthera guangdongensis]|uniref:Uncharacterized protein n=1 Tax=Platanthera guangdongensis TaxID=2320717 RepID=A0ABR2MB17_9ASPA
MASGDPHDENPGMDKGKRKAVAKEALSAQHKARLIEEERQRLDAEHLKILIYIYAITNAWQPVKDITIPWGLNRGFTEEEAAGQDWGNAHRSPSGWIRGIKTGSGHSPSGSISAQPEISDRGTVRQDRSFGDLGKIADKNRPDRGYAAGKEVADPPSGSRNRGRGPIRSSTRSVDRQGRRQERLGFL